VANVNASRFLSDPRKVARAILMGSLSFFLTSILTQIAFLAGGDSYPIFVIAILIIAPTNLIFHSLGVLLHIFYTIQAFNKGRSFGKFVKFGWIMSMIYGSVGILLFLSLVFVDEYEPVHSLGFNLITIFHPRLAIIAFVWLASIFILSVATLKANSHAQASA
jgi:hypothetical protein